ncbi:SRPBCC family protein [Mangrovimonas cancribranchiae]|uniref:SRPBCC family protein n=1 Tax=Mangrovimonas cancribranchiae TaxID=3080055 RepID=A0AAU6P1P5_9FLAO
MTSFEGYIDINKPQKEVSKIFANPDNLIHYQDGFVKKELIRGEAGKAGAVSKMYYKYGKRDMVLTETIVKNELPNTFIANYHHKHMDNSLTSEFVVLNENKTRYKYYGSYTRISWVIPKLIAIFYPKLYRKQAEKWMTQFKNYVESR